MFLVRRVFVCSSVTACPLSSFRPRRLMSSPSSATAISGTWTVVSNHISLNDLKSNNRLMGRSSNAAGICGDKLLVFSGENTPRVPIDDAVHVFDLKSREWSKIEKKNEQVAWPSARIGHAGATVGDAFYITGGRTGLQAGDKTLDDVWRFDLTKREWTQIDLKGSPPIGLSYHVLAAHGTNIYCFGGCTADHGRSNGLWKFDTTTNEWSILSALGNEKAPCQRGGPGLAALEDRVYVAFGYNGKEEQKDLWAFDLASKEWTQIDAAGDKPTPRSVTDLVALKIESKDALFVFGGEFTPSAQGHDGAGEYHLDAYVYWTSEKGWSQVKPTDDSQQPVARGWFNSLRYGTNQVVAFGGFDGVERRNDVYLWTLKL